MNKSLTPRSAPQPPKGGAAALQSTPFRGQGGLTPPLGGLGATPQDVCFQLFADKIDYYHHWYHDRPMLITSERRDELRRMQALLYKCIVYMAEHYREWVPQYMPLDDKVMEILDRQSRYPFRAGAYRPDYLISDDGRLLFVEITSRFFGHGIWANYPSEAMAQQFMAEHQPSAPQPPEGGAKRCAATPPSGGWGAYNSLLTYMRDIIPPLGGQGASIYVLKSSDRGSESTFYTKFYEYYGHEVTIYEAAEVEANIDQWSHDAVVFSALNQHDLLSFKMETLQAMIDVRMLNDFRTIFLTHDKRFLHLIFVDDFTRQCLTEEETTFLRQHTIPTYLAQQAPQPPKGGAAAQQDTPFRGQEGLTPPLGGLGAEADAWEDALLHKDRYILKPYDLGKSVGLYAGVMTDEETWRKILAPQPPKGGEPTGCAATPPLGGWGAGRVLHSADPVYYSRLKEYAQKNRNHPTEAESLLWSVLSGKGLDGVKFRRQHIIGQYIADFVCLDKGLVVELDGHHHSLPPFCEDDAVRTEYLNKEGYHVIRFTNEQVIHHLDDTLKQIRAALRTPPLGGWGAYILQPFIKQRTYPCVWEGKHYDEYVCGMMLCMDDRYFDSGVFRTSSAPVTNKVDDRKMCVIHSDDEELKKYCYVL